MPKLHFHIAAQTLMSQKLLNLEQYENVSLYQGASTFVLDELFKKCDYYFDINHRGEIVSAVYRAFRKPHIIETTLQVIIFIRLMNLTGWCRMHRGLWRMKMS